MTACKEGEGEPESTTLSDCEVKRKRERLMIAPFRAEAEALPNLREKQIGYLHVGVLILRTGRCLGASAEVATSLKSSSLAARPSI
jgi:hypothetical protein